MKNHIKSYYNFSRNNYSITTTWHRHALIISKEAVEHHGSSTAVADQVDEVEEINVWLVQVLLT